MYDLDVAAAKTSDGQAVTIGIVNATEAAYEVALKLDGAELDGEGRWWSIAHPDPMAYNDPGQEPQVAIEERRLPHGAEMVTVPAYSVNLYELKLR